MLSSRDSLTVVVGILSSVSVSSFSSSLVSSSPVSSSHSDSSFHGVSSFHSVSSMFSVAVSVSGITVSGITLSVCSVVVRFSSIGKSKEISGLVMVGCSVGRSKDVLLLSWYGVSCHMFDIEEVSVVSFRLSKEIVPSGIVHVLSTSTMLSVVGYSFCVVDCIIGVVLFVIVVLSEFIPHANGSTIASCAGVLVGVLFAQKSSSSKENAGMVSDI